MTVTANTTRNDYTAGSAQSEYDYTFQLNEAADVDVYLDGVKQTLNTHYVVQNVGNASGGTIVFTLEDENGDPIHPTQGAIINIVMAMDLDRDTNYQPSGAFLAADVNNDFDRLWLATNQQQTAVNRALRLKDTDVTTSSMELPLKDDRKGKLLGFNATTGDPEVSTHATSNWDTAYDNMITSASFSGSTLTLTQQDGGTVTASHTPYLPIAGGSVTGDIDFGSSKAIFGSNDDLQIYNFLGASIIKEAGLGNLEIRATDLVLKDDSGGKYAQFTENGDAKLFYDNSEKLATTSGGISVTGTITATGYNDSNWNAAYNDKINSASFDTSNGVLTLTQQDGGTVTVDLDGRYSTDTGIALGDNQKATFGDSNDLQIYHDGSNSRIREAGTGSLLLDAENLYLRNTTGDSYFQGLNGGAANVFYNGSVKLTTTTTGIDVTGTVTADGGLIEGSTGLTIRNDAVGANEPKLVFDNDTFSGANYGKIQTGNGGLQLILESPSTSTFQNRHKIVLNGGGSDDITFSFSTDNGTSYKNSFKIENNDISFYEDTGTTPKFFWDASAESLGIGTTSPSGKLEVSSADFDTLYLTRSTAGSATILMKNSSNNGGLVQSLGNGGLSFFSTVSNSSSERMRIDASGNVGIGTTSPLKDLNVSNTTGSSEIMISTSDTGTGSLEFGDVTSGTVARGFLKYNHSDNSLQFGSAQTERMRIDSSGNVGIGGNPAAVTHGPHLDLVGNRGTLTVGTGYFEDNGNTNFIGGARSLAFGSAGSSTERMRIDASGNVGIGTTSPNDKFHVANGSTGAGYLRIANNEGYARLGTDGGNLLLDVGGSEKARIDSSGNVGIGTTSPTAKLDVTAGNIVAGGKGVEISGNTSYIADGSYGTSLDITHNYQSNDGSFRAINIDLTDSGTNNQSLYGLYVNAENNYLSGNVGIGTTSPDSLMHLSANTGATLTLESTDIAIATNEVIGAIDFYSNDASGIGAASRGSISLIAEDAAGAGSMLFKTSNAATASTERMRINASGKLLLNTATHTLTDSEMVVASEYSASGTTTGGITLSSRQSGSWRNSGIFANGTALTFTTGDNGLNGAQSSSERMRIDASGNLLVGKTTSASSTAGITLEPAGAVVATRDGGECFIANRKTSDGTIIQLRKDQTTVGSIGTGGGDLNIGTGDTRIRFNDATDNIIPLNASNGYRNAAISIGDSTARFKDLYLSGTGYFGTSVGIGTTSPSANLHVSSLGDTIARITSADGNGAFLDLGDASDPDGGRIVYDSGSNLALYTASTERLRIDSSGNVGIGTTSPSQLLHVNGTARATTVLSGDGTASAPSYSFSSDTDTGMFKPFPDTLAFSEGGVERMRINSSGYVGIGLTSPTHPLHVNGVAKVSSFQSSAGSIITSAGNYGVAGVYIRNWSSTSTSYSNMIDFAKANGTSVGSIKSNNTSTQFNTTSDERLKENIRNAEDAGAKIDAIQIRQFDWKDGGEHQDYGVIAQELKEVAPEAVSEGYDEEDMWGVDYSKLVPTLIKEIQSLRNRVAELEKK